MEHWNSEFYMTWLVWPRPGFAVVLFFSGEKVLHEIYGMYISVFIVFVHLMSCVVFVGGPCTLLTTCQRRNYNYVRVPIHDP